MAAGGVGAYNSVTLDKILAGKAAAVAPFIGEIEQGMRGGSTPQDLETMFQLLYLRFTQPRADPVVFTAMAAQAKALLANQDASPDVVFDQVIDNTLSRNHARRQSETPATVDQWNLATALAFYKARFADAGNFTFVFVGSFTPEAIKPLVETYIASLPATRAQGNVAGPGHLTADRHGPGDHQEGHRAEEQRGHRACPVRSSTTMRTGWRFEPPRSCCSRGCSTRSVRSSAGTYSITATTDTAKFPRPEFRLRIDWTCDPARAAMLGERVLQEIGFVRTTPLSSNQMALIRENLLRDFERNSQDNGYFLNQISRRYADGDAANVAAVEKVPEQIAALTSAAVQQAAQTYLNTDRYVKVTLVPEGNQ